LNEGKMNEKNKNNSYPKSRITGLEGLDSSPLGRLGGVSLTRKEFLNTLARYGFLALIAFLAAFLITNRKTRVEEECTNNFYCRDCTKQDICKIDKTHKK
jgi:hypothetical protein